MVRSRREGRSVGRSAGVRAEGRRTVCFQVCRHTPVFTSHSLQKLSADPVSSFVLSTAHVTRPCEAHGPYTRLALARQRTVDVDAPDGTVVPIVGANALSIVRIVD